MTNAVQRDGVPMGRTELGSCFRKNLAVLFFVVVGLCLSANAELTSEDYVSDGLVAHWDGIDNSVDANGVRFHSDTLTTWADLTGNGNDVPSIPSWVTVEGNSLVSKVVSGKSSTGIANSKSSAPVLDSIKVGGTATLNTGAKYPFTMEVVIKSEGWKYTDNYENMQAPIVTHRGYFGYRRPKKNGKYEDTCFFWAGPYDNGTRIGYYNWRPEGKNILSDMHSISGVNLNGHNYAYIDGEGSDVEEFIDLKEVGASSWKFFSNLRMDIRIYAIRVYNRVLTPEEVARNAKLDRIRFLGENEAMRIRPFAADMKFSLNTTAMPEPVVEDAITLEVLEKDRDYTVSYANNTGVGTATVTVTGEGERAGQMASRDFVIDDASTYEPLAYIESTGTQWIDTDYLPKTTTKMLGGIAFMGSADRRCGGYGVFGCAEGDYSYSLEFGGDLENDGNTKLYPWFNKAPKAGGANVSFGISEINRRASIQMTSGGGKVHYGLSVYDAVKNTYNHADPLKTWTLFAVRGNDGAVSPFTLYRMRIYNWCIAEGDETIRDFVPCRRRFDGAVGLFDKVSGRFFGNAGTGRFVAGERDEELPAGYRRLVSVTSTGTQIIDTKYHPNPTTKFELKASFGAKKSGLGANMFGTVEPDDAAAFSVNFGGNDPSTLYTWLNKTYSSGGETRKFATDDATLAGENVYSFLSSNGKMTVNTHTPSWLSYPKTTTNEVNALCLCGRRVADGSLEPLEVRSMTVYQCRIQDSFSGETAVVRDFVPCLREGDGVAGLYDMVDGVFYANANPNSTDGFEYEDYPSELKSAELPEGYAAVEYLVATGHQAVASGVKATARTTTLAVVTPEAATVGNRIFSACGAREPSAVTAGELIYEALIGDDLKWGAALVDGPIVSTLDAVDGVETCIRLDGPSRALYVDGRTAVAFATVPTAESFGEITFCRGGSQAGHWGRMRLSGAWIWEDGVLARRLVPCVRCEDGLTGLYDVIGKEFHPSIGETPFLQGSGAVSGVATFSGNVLTSRLEASSTYKGLSSFSFALWVKNPGANDDVGVLVGNGALGDTSAGFCCYVQQETQPATLCVRTGKADESIGTYSIPLANFKKDRWYHVAFVHDFENNEAKFYLNGNIVDRKSGGDVFNPQTDASDKFVIGNGPADSTCPFNGEIAEVSIWGRALEDGEVGALRFNAVQGTENGLLGYWPLQGGMEGLKDHVANGVEPHDLDMANAGDFGFANDVVEWTKRGLILILK